MPTFPSSWPILAIAVGVLLFLLLAVALIKAKKGGKKTEPDYRTFFIIGITFFVVGMGSENFGMWPMGLILAIIGIANKDKWKKQKKWPEMNKGERTAFVTIIAGLSFLLLAGIATVLLKGG